MKITLLDADTLGNNTDFSGIKALASKFTIHKQTPADKLIERAQEADIIVTNKAKFSNETFKQLPNLKLVCITATGTDNIDLNAAKKYHITVKNVANYSTPSVAQHVMALIFNLSSHLSLYEKWTKAGKWQKHHSFNFLDYPILELHNRTLCLIGYGNIAKQVEKIALATGLKVIIAERPEATTTRNDRVPFYDALQKADIISIHCPLTTETKHQINKKAIEHMKDSAILINTSRGPVIDEQALAEAMNRGKFFGVGLDVLDTEPPSPKNPLLFVTHPNFIITPHIAWAADQSIKRLIAGVIQNIKDFIHST